MTLRNLRSNFAPKNPVKIAVTTEPCAPITGKTPATIIGFTSPEATE